MSEITDWGLHAEEEEKRLLNQVIFKIIYN